MISKIKEEPFDQLASHSFSTPSIYKLEKKQGFKSLNLNPFLKSVSKQRILGKESNAMRSRMVSCKKLVIAEAPF